MRIVEAGSGIRREALVEGGPVVEVLVGEGGAKSENLAVARVVVPPGGAMAEHDHAGSEALVVAEGGRLTIRQGEREETLEGGKMALLGVGERVSLANPSPSEPASLLAFFAPPGFARTLAAWPEEA